MVSTPKLQVLLHDLKPFTNYTLRVSCFTRIGESIRSDDLKFQTLQDGTMSRNLDTWINHYPLCKLVL